MVIKALILLTLLAQTPYHRDTESWQERKVRMEHLSEDISAAVDRATCNGAFNQEGCVVIWGRSKKALAMALITQAVHETHLSHLIQDNQCRLEIGECDARKVRKKNGEFAYIQQSFSLWQLKMYRDVPLDDKELIRSGREGTGAAAWLASRRLSSALRACKTMEGAFARYGVGDGCYMEGSKDRVKTWERLMSSHPDLLRKSIQRQKQRLVSASKPQ